MKTSPPLIVDTTLFYLILWKYKDGPGSFSLKREKTMNLPALIPQSISTGAV